MILLDTVPYNIYANTLCFVNRNAIDIVDIHVDHKGTGSTFPTKVGAVNDMATDSSATVNNLGETALHIHAHTIMTQCNSVMSSIMYSKIRM